VKRDFSILFVCSGNTCRSPLAERILKKRIGESIKVSSAGTGAIPGVPASSGAKAAARVYGVSLAGFASKPVTGRRVARADLILTMTRSHRKDIGTRWPDALGKTYVLSEYTDSGRGSITDPLGGPESGYLQCAADLDDEIARMLPELARTLGEEV
jgi:protein-tyrosine-phosphatase